MIDSVKKKPMEVTLSYYWDEFITAASALIAELIGCPQLEAAINKTDELNPYYSVTTNYEIDDDIEELTDEQYAKIIELEDSYDKGILARMFGTPNVWLDANEDMSKIYVHVGYDDYMAMQNQEA